MVSEAEAVDHYHVPFNVGNLYYTSHSITVNTLNDRRLYSFSGRSQLFVFIGEQRVIRSNGFYTMNFFLCSLGVVWTRLTYDFVLI